MDNRIHIGDMSYREVSESEVDSILSKSLDRDLDIEEIKLLSYAKKNFWPQIIKMANKVKEKFFGKDIHFYVPLYISSHCVNNCLYCDYRRDNEKLPRKRLNFEEFKREVNYLHQKGYKKRIEIVSGSDPIISLDDFCTYVEYVKSLGIENVLMNSRLMGLDEYVSLKKSGLDWNWLWVESYSKEHFKAYHPRGGEKYNFEARLDSYDAAAQAGLNIGLGVLLGLSPDWRMEMLSAIAHAKYLHNKYKVGIGFGTPRFRAPNNAPLQKTPFPEAATDDVFRLIVALYRLGFRNSYIDGSTRENIDMLKKLWKGGGSLTNPEVKTIPGGYTLGTKGSQFAHYSYDLLDFIDIVKTEGLRPIY